MGSHSRPTALATRRRTATGLTVALSAVAFALAGCTATGDTYSVLEQEAQPEDEVPSDLPSYAWDDADPTSARFVGEEEGTSLWLARASDDTGTCLLAYVDEETWVLGCGGDGAPFRVGGIAGSFTVIPDGAHPPDGMAAISENVYSTGAD